MQRSFVDPVSYVRTVHVEDPALSNETLESLSSARDKARALDAWRAQQPSSGALLFEEAFRYWLGLRLPYLYRHATRALRDEVAAFHALSLEHGDWRHWQVELPILHSLDREWWVGLDASGRAIAAPGSAPDDGTVRQLGTVSSAALIDALAALASFRVRSAASLWLDRGAFRRWSDHPVTAHTVIGITASALRDGELAMRALGSLIVAAFGTTNPVSAFAYLLGRLAHMAGSDHFALWRRQPEPSRWTEVFDRFRRELPLAAPTVVGDACEPLTIAEALEETVEHPFLSDRAREWAARADEEAAYDWFVEQAPWAPRHVTESVWRDFQPPASLYCLHLGDGTRRVFLTLDRADFETLDAAVSYDDVHDLVVLHGVVQRAADVPDVAEHRLCHHTACPEYGANYCSTYPVIPRDYHRCTFPVRLAQLRRGVVLRSGVSSGLDASVELGHAYPKDVPVIPS